MDRTQLAEKISSSRQILECEGVLHIALFGSRARGDFRQDSDVDVLLDIAPGAKFSILNLVGVEEIISKATGLKSNAVMRRSLDDGFKKTIASDIVEIF
jgi:predicted nucleotidyltransferase